MMPSQKTGIEMPTSASTVIVRSDHRPAVTAEIVPTRIPKKSQMIAAPIERENVSGHDDEDQEDNEADGDQHDAHADQPTDQECGHQCSTRTLARGSRASRRPSPKMFSERTVSTIAMPGVSVCHGAVRIRLWPSEMSVPHDGFGSWTPAPRYESAASSRMLFATISVKKTSTLDATFGRISANMIRGALAPCAIAASTNSFSRRDRICPRSGRPM